MEVSYPSGGALMLHRIASKQEQPAPPGSCCSKRTTLHFDCGQRLVVTRATACALRPSEWVEGPAGPHERCPICQRSPDSR
jgi:hypothetical protein